MASSYYAPTGGHPGQHELLTDRAMFTEAYAVIPRGTMRDIVVSFLPHWELTRLWVLARPLSGFAETFSQYIVEVLPNGGSDRPESDPSAEAVLFVVDGEMDLTVDGTAHRLEPGGYAYLPPARPGPRTTGARTAALPLDPQGVREGRRARHAAGVRDARTRRPGAADARHGGALGHDALRRAERPAARHARQHRHASSPAR
jgi:quercetin dioxygenase-like cupin family protein